MHCFCCFTCTLYIIVCVMEAILLLYFELSKNGDTLLIQVTESQYLHKS